VGAQRVRDALGILALMDIRFRYSLSGVAFAPFLDLERVVAGAGALLTER
jgi:hypothetical protein